MTGQVHLACGLRFCQNPQETQTNLSIGLRISALALGILAVIVGTLILLNTHGLSQFGATVGWITFSLGCVFIVIGISTKCIKAQINHPSYKKNEQIKQVSHQLSQVNESNKELKHGTHSIYLHHFQNYGISSIYPPVLVELILKIDLIWKQHASHTIPRTQYFFDIVHRMKEAIERQKITMSFSSNENVTQEFTTGARHGGEWARECRFFLREAFRSWEKFEQEEKETLKKLDALLQLMNILPPMIISIARHQLDLTSNAYEQTITYPIEAGKLKFTLLEQEAREEFNGPYLKIGKPTILNSRQIRQHRILINGFSEHPKYQDSRFIINQTNDYHNILVTRQLLTAEDHVELMEETQRRKYIQYWIEAFHCQNLIEKYRVYL